MVLVQVKERLPWFLKALPSEDCAKGGAGAYTDALQQSSKESSGIKVQAAASCWFHINSSPMRCYL